MIFYFKYKILKFLLLSYMVIFIVVNLIILIFNISLINKIIRREYYEY